jgi:hypothetical protein
MPAPASCIQFATARLRDTKSVEQLAPPQVELPGAKGKAAKAKFR